MNPQTRSEQAYLDHLVATGQVVNVFLNNGIRLVGVIIAHSGGGDVLWLQPQNGRGDDFSMIYSHNISTINSLNSSADVRGPIARNERGPLPGSN
jgi:sRNA-binding regulator protein Hfq